MKDIDNDLKRIVAVISNKFNIEEIYLNANNSEKTPNVLVILVSNKYVNTLGEIVPRIVNSIRYYSQYKVVSYVAFQAKDKIKDGNLYLFTACQREKLVYKKENSEFKAIPEGFDFMKCKELAFGEREKHKVDEFKDGYYYFKAHGKYSLASFMLHQVIELTYRSLELFLVGKERITHSIRSHHLSLKDNCGEYSGVFDDENDEDVKLLQVLENIYRATRYEDNFHVEIETLQNIECKMIRLGELSKSIIENHIFNFEYIQIKDEVSRALCPFQASDNLANNNVKFFVKDTFNTMNVGPNIDKTLNNIIEMIKIFIPSISSIHYFGIKIRVYQSWNVAFEFEEGSMRNIRNYDLLLISPDNIKKRVQYLQDVINTNQYVSVHLLSFTEEEVQDELLKNSNFFHKILNYIDGVYFGNASSDMWDFHWNGGYCSEEEFDKKLLLWDRYEKSAKDSLEKSRAVKNQEEILGKIFHITNALNNACIGLLKVMLDYNHNSYCLKDLYLICSSVWPIADDVLPRDTLEELLLFEKVINVNKERNNFYKLDFDWRIVYCYEARCEKFIEKIRPLIEEMEYLD